ncbi:MAG: hypothetical protein OEY09_04220 [Gammaproteobacteria bacterium]|nr:hypothetical protein [Gammaproteobacteria bacterium]
MLAVKDEFTFMENTNPDSLQVYALSLEEMSQVILRRSNGEDSKSQWETLKNKIEITTDYSASVWDKALLGQLVSEWGYAGIQSFIKTYKGKPHIMLKGRPELRKILEEASRAAESAKVVNIGLVRSATVVNTAKRDSILTTVFNFFKETSPVLSSNGNAHRSIFS